MGSDLEDEMGTVVTLRVEGLDDGSEDTFLVTRASEDLRRDPGTLLKDLESLRI